ncbi:MAG: competence/damage-inducible protein A, partial [Neisseria elongata]
AVKPHIEFGIKAEGGACRDLDKAWDEVLQRLRKLGAELKDRAG